jgi:signal transduction histidine kinase
MSNNSIDTHSRLKRQIEVLRRVDGFMSTLTDLYRLLEQIMRESLYITDAEACSLALYDQKTDELCFEIALGEKGPETKRVKIKRGEGIVWEVFLTGNSRNIKDAYSEKKFAPGVDQKTILAVPMRRRSKAIGVIEVLNKKNADPFSEEDQVILEILADHAAIAIENARLYQDNIEKERLASLGLGISEAVHGIKNILNLITMGSSGVDLGIEKGNLDMLKRSWQSVKNGCDQISGMVLDMLAYSKGCSTELTPVPLNQILADFIQMFKPRLEKYSVAFVQDFDPEIGLILLDTKGFHLCVMNLFSNALDALKNKKGCITVKSLLLRGSKEVEIQISDNGCGLSSIDKIFDVCYSTKESKGLGFRLPVAKKIVNELGGCISVHSKEGEGTTFYIRFPTYP